jgi:hypothetical protein
MTSIYYRYTLKSIMVSRQDLTAKFIPQLKKNSGRIEIAVRNPENGPFGVDLQ